MKIYWIILITILVLCPQLLLSQTALQEIVRFDVPYGNYFMNHVEGNGDIDGDGTNDIIYACGENEGAESSLVHVYIHHSIPCTSLVADQILVQPNQSYECGFGNSISYSGDLNGDGIDDLVIGSYLSGFTNAGAVHIYYGGETLSQQPDVSLHGENYVTGNSWHLIFGSRILSNCDINGDGYDDLIVHAVGNLPESYGNVFVFFGGETLSTNCALRLSGTVDNERLGNELATGDINGDGFDDIVLTRRLPIAGTSDYYQYVDIYSGGVNPGNEPVYEALIGTSSVGALGSRILANGDLNNDGYDDIVMTYHTYTSVKLLLIYGNSCYDSLSVDELNFESSYSRVPQFYCDLDSDNYSDVCMWQYTTSDHYGFFTVYKQDNSGINIVSDFSNIGETSTSLYGRGFLLGDINHDGSQDLFVYSTGYSPPQFNYATILTESYVEADDETIPRPESGIFCYPNPFRDRVNVKITSRTPKPAYDITVYDIKGRKVYSKNKLRTDDFSWNPARDCKDTISSGIYLMRITENNKVIDTSKVIYTK